MLDSVRGRSRNSVVTRLRARHRAAVVLDGDEVQAALAAAPGRDPAGRAYFYAMLGRLACLLAHQRLLVIVAATAHRRAYRDWARAAAPRFIEVRVATPLAECVATGNSWHRFRNESGA